MPFYTLRVWTSENPSRVRHSTEFTERSVDFAAEHAKTLIKRDPQFFGEDRVTISTSADDMVVWERPKEE